MARARALKHERWSGASERLEVAKLIAKCDVTYSQMTCHTRVPPMFASGVVMSLSSNHHAMSSTHRIRSNIAKLYPSPLVRRGTLHAAKQMTTVPTTRNVEPNAHRRRLVCGRTAIEVLFLGPRAVSRLHSESHVHSM